MIYLAIFALGVVCGALVMAVWDIYAFDKFLKRELERQEPDELVHPGVNHDSTFYCLTVHAAHDKGGVVTFAREY